MSSKKNAVRHIEQPKFKTRAEQLHFQAMLRGEYQEEAPQLDKKKFLIISLLIVLAMAAALLVVNHQIDQIALFNEEIELGLTVGTINNDDSTFAVADKVYDRAIPIDLDSRAEAFECEKTPPVFISTDHLNQLFEEAKLSYPLSDDVMAKLEDMNAYLIKHFHLAFGNRIMRQIRDYVPCYIACGGTMLEAVDFIVAKKVLRKFESLSLGFMKDELTRFNTYLDKLFGKNTMEICKSYVEYLKKNS